MYNLVKIYFKTKIKTKTSVQLCDIALLILIQPISFPPKIHLTIKELCSIISIIPPKTDFV